MNKIIKKTPFWILTSVVLLIALVLSFSQEKTYDGKIITKQEMHEKSINYINDVLLGGVDQVESIEVSEERGIYKISVAYDGNEINSYATKDGKLFFPEALNMEKDYPEIFDDQEDEQEETNEIDGNEDIGELIECLEKENFIIYGSATCPYCLELVDMFGGYEKIDPIYVECTEEQEVCQENNITSVPAIFIDNQPYQGERSIKAFAEAVNCQLY